MRENPMGYVQKKLKGENILTVALKRERRYNMVLYWISEVCYNPQKTHISSVKIYQDGHISSGNHSIWSRQNVVTAIKNGHDIWTMTKERGKWIKGAKVQIVPVEGTEYIKTVNDSTPKDNLGNLPKFC